MAASPYGFLRGAAGVMADDLAHLPATGITPVICGDSHLGNFGFYASPERDLVIDLNDFDEAHPGSWEWDLRRLAASIWVAGRQNSATEAQCESAVADCVATYRKHVRWLAKQPLLARAFERLDVDRLHKSASDESLRAEILRAARRARTNLSDRALPRLTEPHGTGRRIVEQPPLVTRVSDRGGRAHRRGPRRLPRHACPPSGAGCSADTPSSTSRTRSSAWAASASAPTSPCARAAPRTTWSSSS